MRQAVIVLPTFNEKQNIKTLIPTIFAVAKNIKDWHLSVLVVDDNSPDKTGNEVMLLQKKYPNLFLISGEKKGLGHAYSVGFSTALKKMRPDVIFEMDADWSHHPILIPKFLQAIKLGADFVIGSRYVKGGSIPSNWGLHRKIFSFFGNIIIRLGFMNLKIHEWTNGYRAIRADFIRGILSEISAFNGYVFQIAILDRAVKNNLNIVEIPIQFKERENGESKISSFRYIFDILSYIFLNSSFIKFAIVGFIGFIINIIGLEFFYYLGLFPGLASALGAELSIISNFIFNNIWSFSHKKIAGKETLFPKFIQFNTVSFGSIIIQFVVVGIGTYLFGDETRLIFLIISVFLFIIPYSYYMYNRYIWKHKQY